MLYKQGAEKLFSGSLDAQSLYGAVIFEVKCITVIHLPDNWRRVRI